MGTLSIGVFFPLNWWEVLADCVVEFRTRSPRIRLNVREDSMEALLERLDQDLVDIVIGRLASGFGGDQYSQEPLRDDHPLFVARQGHPLTQKPVTLEDLLGFPWVLPEQPNIIRQQLEFAVRDMGLRFGTDVMSSQVFAVDVSARKQERHARACVPMHRGRVAHSVSTATRAL